ncbi:hypothetical protein FHS97_000961 [Sphingomonas endophytica]|uniref:Uncharacterized protein n=1 Tax=Sphingomonas endophytica TaxID=869719 RepID=A0ABR6N2P3_9SPHN|nr:hypothetical protein [Sphingomonas endophytica]MBB5725053.1 hypothetical protein [Sphingomonas endophytica]
MQRRRDDHDLATYGAWRGEFFARQDKLKPVGQYLAADKPGARSGGSQTPAERALVFRALQAAGAPIKIEVLDGPPPLRRKE